jgi:glycosyltransferase involved in cell wall biosynthesis
MRILHVITSLGFAGAEKLMVDLLPGLKSKGYEVDLLLFDGTDKPFKRQLEAAGIKIYHTMMTRSFKNPINLVKMIPYLRHYDVVHAHNISPQLYVAIGGLFSSAILCTTEHNTTNHRRNLAWYKPIDRWMYNRYQHIICISKEAEISLRDYLGNACACISTVNNGVDVHKYSSAIPSDELQKIAPGCRFIMMVSSFRNTQKDQDTLIKSMQWLPDKFHLFLVGDGARREICEQLTKDLNLESRVHFLGLREDIPALLRASDYVVLSSQYEGLSLSSIEGMCGGKPFIASYVDGLKDIVEGAGLFFPYQDDKKLASVIQRLEDNPDEYARVAARCMQRAEEYDISKMVDGYDKVYQSLKQNKK